MSLGRRFPALIRSTAVLSAVLLAGCYETKQEFTVNPDGSGKVVHECVLQSSGGLGKVDASPEGTKAAIREIIEKSTGVDAWRDVSYRRLDDGRLFFRGTAYFKNLSQFDIPNQTAMQFVWSKLGNGRVKLAARGDSTPPAWKEQTQSNRPTVDKEKTLAQERANYQNMKPLLTAFLGGSKQEVRLRLPGRMETNSIFEPVSGGAVRIQWEGAKLLAAMDKLVTDDEWVKRYIAAGPAGQTNHYQIDAALLDAVLFGKHTPREAVLTGATRPLFDYATELAAAQVEDARLRAELGVSAAGTGTPSPIIPSAQGQPVKSLQVAGVRWVSAAGRPRELKPFHEEAGLTLSLFVELPGSVQAMSDDSRLDTAIADDGTNLLPASPTKRRLRFSRMSADGTSALIEIDLAPPPAGVTGLKELSGQLKYTTMTGRQQMDLGFPDLKAGAVGTALESRLVAIEAGSRGDGAQLVRVKVAVRPEKLLTAWLVTGNHWQELERRGFAGGVGGAYEFTFESKRAVPAQSRIVVGTFDEMAAYESAFKLENVPLLGISPASQK